MSATAAAGASAPAARRWRVVVCANARAAALCRAGTGKGYIATDLGEVEAPNLASALAAGSTRFHYPVARLAATEIAAPEPARARLTVERVEVEVTVTDETPRKPRAARRGAEHAKSDGHGADLARLGALALLLAMEKSTVTIADVRVAAVERGHLTGKEGAPDMLGKMTKPRELAWLGALMPGLHRAGYLEPLMAGGFPVYAPSPMPGANGNKHRVWAPTAALVAAVQAPGDLTRLARLVFLPDAADVGGPG